MELVDTHAHLDDKQFTADLDDVLERARTVGVSTIIAVGTTLETSRRAIELAQRSALVRAAAGLHPNYITMCSPGDQVAVGELATAPEIVAIGETGLDRFRDDTPFDDQLQSFAEHALLSHRLDKPLIIHSRDAEADVLRALEESARAGRPVRGVMHSFTGSAAMAARALELGLYLSFAGQLTYTNRKFDALREVARFVPLDRLLVETDSPYLAPEPHRGERNEPARVTRTAQRLAELRGMSLDELASQTTRNARLLFGI